MNKRFLKRGLTFLASLLLVLMLSMSAFAASDDNSLSSLGITTEGATVTPEFAYNIWEYDVTVPAGTGQLTLDPVPSSGSASIVDISGTTLNEDGTGTVLITVQAESGAQFTYQLNVTSSGEAPAEVQTEPVTEKQTEPQTEKQTEPATEKQTENTNMVMVDKNTVQEAENTITSLQGEISQYKKNMDLYTKIIYGLIAVAVILLFFVVNLLLRKRDLKAELNEYRSLGYSNSKKAQKARAKAQKKAAQNAKNGGNGAKHPQQSRNGQPYGVNPAAPLDVEPQTSHRKPRQMPSYEGGLKNGSEGQVYGRINGRGQNGVPAQNVPQAGQAPQPAGPDAKPAKAPKHGLKKAAPVPKQAEQAAQAVKQAAPAPRQAEQAAQAVKQAAPAPKQTVPAAPAAPEDSARDVQVNMIDL